MKLYYDALLHATAWLYVVILRWGPLYVDLWTFPHILSGFGLMAVCISRGGSRGNAWFWTLVVLAGYEVLELILAVLSVDVFLPEILLDKLNDIIVGAAAALFAEWVITRYRVIIRPLSQALPIIPGNAVFSTVVLAFFWTGSYGYRYNVSFLNSPGINWWAFVLWTCGLLFALAVFAMSRSTMTNGFVRLAAAVAAYWVALIALEFVGYNVLGIRETTNGGARALIGNLIHGNPMLHVFYLVAAPVVIGLNVIGERMLGWKFQPVPDFIHHNQPLTPGTEASNPVNFD